MNSTHTIGVVGAGIMGTGIAQVCVLAGRPVVMIDVDLERVGRARSGIANALGRLVDKGKLAASERVAALARLDGRTNDADLRGVVAEGRLGRKGGRGFYTYERAA